MKRKEFIASSLIACAAATTGVSLASCTKKEEPKKTLPKGTRILFQGDSITDNYRDLSREDIANDSQMLGLGYARFAAARLLRDMPECELQIFNRGISGNKVFQLKDRWQKDCLDLKPDILSIAIGVNDFWHTLTGHHEGTAQEYKKQYKELVEETLAALPGVRIIICEPFTIKGGSAIEEDKWGEFAEYQKAAREVAEELNLTFIPYQKLFREVEVVGGCKYWGADGIHPSVPGLQMMADAWLKSL